MEPTNDTQGADPSQVFLLPEHFFTGVKETTFFCLRNNLFKVKVKRKVKRKEKQTILRGQIPPKVFLYPGKEHG